MSMDPKANYFELFNLCHYFKNGRNRCVSEQMRVAKTLRVVWRIRGNLEYRRNIFNKHEMETW